MKCFLPALLIGCVELRAASPRHTATVEIAAQAEPSVVAIYSESNGALSSGSGSLISPLGYILTNDHVVRHQNGQALFHDGQVRPFRVVGRCPEKDLALVLVATKEPLKALSLGRSDDLMTGEPVLAAGNPGGRGIVFSSGIISSPRMMIDAPSALLMRQFPEDVRDRFIQFDAASNPGNSGGPLLNAEGAQIGVVSASNKSEQNINFAIPVDRVRSWLARMTAPETKGNFYLGIECDPLADRATVSTVAPDSPAKVGIQPGDVLLRAGEVDLGNGLDWTMVLVGEHAGKKLPVTWQRHDKKLSAVLQSTPFPAPAAETELATEAGLKYSVYVLDNPVRLPDFSKLQPVRQGLTTTIDPRGIEPNLPSFGLVLEGFVDLQFDDWFRLVIESDDGSRLQLHDLVIDDNDGPHPPRAVGAVLRVAKGLHPLRIEYFELSGDSTLRLFTESAEGERTEIAKDALRHRK